ncbi:MAG: hypothetical protein VCA35_12140 [Roseibacillus sp.]
MLGEAHAELGLLEEVPGISVALSCCRLALFTHEERWDDAGICADNLCELEPDHFLASARIQRKLNMVGSAIEFLLHRPPAMEELPEFHYQLGRYYALLGEQPLDSQNLGRAAELDAHFWNQARTEPGLAPLHHRLPPESLATIEESLALPSTACVPRERNHLKDH